MKEYIKNKTLQNIWFAALITVFFCGTVFVYKNIHKQRRRSLQLHAVALNGTIETLKDQNRGNYYMRIQFDDSLWSVSGLPIAWEVEQYQISVGDSSSKPAFNDTLSVYKFRNGMFVKSCEIGLYKMQ